MKRLLFIILSIFIFSSTYAINPKEILNVIPVTFKPECYKYYKKIAMDNIFWEGDTYKLLVNKDDLLITHFGFILPYKKVDSKTIIIKRFYDSYIELYSGYSCDEKIDIKAKEYNNFFVNKNTKIISAFLTKNPKYGIYDKKDFDNDWVEDKIDNCTYRYNPLQKDINNDGVGDACSDNDNDGIIGFFDNCPNNNNPLQQDLNKNGVGDICEFDSDKDNVLDNKDNCIDKYNPGQKDDDLDGVGNICDNCNYYNPAQLDLNKNGIGDICEKIEKKKIDKDGDNVLNEKDNCIDKYNPDQKDIDKDGIGDVCDDNDNRFSQTNKGLFIFLLFISSMIFSGLIFYFKNKFKSNS